MAQQVSVTLDQAIRPEGNPGDQPTQFDFLVTRSGTTDEPLDVDWELRLAGTDPAEVNDFAPEQPTSGTVSFDAGVEQQTVSVFIAGDLSVELDEQFELALDANGLPEGTTLETLRKQGIVRWTNWGIVGMGLAQASTIEPDKTHNPFRWHTEEKQPYPTLTRRAQFYIDHEWFLEAGEELPVHKENPNHGGDRRFRLISGHPRWSIHSMNMTNNIIQNTHRGEPFIILNPEDAKKNGLENGEEVRVVNDAGHLNISVKLSPS